MDDVDGFLTVREVAAVLRCSRQHVHNLVARDELPAVRVGRVLRIRAADVVSMLERRASGAVA